MKLALIKRPDNSLYPCYRSDLEAVQRVKDGRIVLVDFRNPRNAKHHKLIFALAKCTLDNMSGAWNELYLRNPNGAPYLFIKALVMEIGETEIEPNLDGTFRTVPKSISFESMSEDEFQPVSDALFTVCARTLNIDVETLRKNYLEYL